MKTRYKQTRMGGKRLLSFRSFHFCQGCVSKVHLDLQIMALSPRVCRLIIKYKPSLRVASLSHGVRCYSMVAAAPSTIPSELHSVSSESYSDISSVSIAQNTAETSLSMDTPSAVSFEFDYEIRLGPVVENIPSERLDQLRNEISDQCNVTKSRYSRAFLLETNNESDIERFQSLVHTQFLEVHSL